jgi:hypothetical protein
MAPEAREELPHESDDPSFVETWFFNAIDLSRKTVVWVHCAWLPARRKGTHQIVASVDGVPRQLRVLTDDALSSDLLTLAVDPWRSLRVRCPPLDVDVEWNAIMDVVDFGKRMAFDRAHTRQDHYQAGGAVSGFVGGRKLRGRGWRNRSVGPRNVRLLGRHWCITMVGIDEPTLATATLMTPRTDTFTTTPSSVFAATVALGATNVWDEPVIVARRADATPATFRFPDGMTLSTQLEDAVASTCWIPDLTSAPSTDPTTEAVYSTRDWFLPATSSEFGRMVGFYEEGQLFVN